MVALLADLSLPAAGPPSGGPFFAGLSAPRSVVSPAFANLPSASRVQPLDAEVTAGVTHVHRA
jgi:hypothetical protein